ncbi:hypothetical protein T4A_13183 [Trichinella pseudospiralis]|uniref:Uncharacterized protein n=1 Tax=Trichinella pseudospiralis TaxID=6337 RepID=A0A0V1ENW3_TRIPS|nr:hypothetical protein T4A_13183 [Trichinella pseudospiralis]
MPYAAVTTLICTSTNVILVVCTKTGGLEREFEAAKY